MDLNEDPIQSSSINHQESSRHEDDEEVKGETSCKHETTDSKSNLGSKKMKRFDETAKLEQSTEKLITDNKPKKILDKKFSVELLKRVAKSNPLLFEVASGSPPEMIAAAFKYIGERSNLPLIEWCEAVLLYICLYERLNLESLTWNELCNKVEGSHFSINAYLCTSTYKNSCETLLNFFEMNRAFKEQSCPSLGNKAFCTIPPVNYEALNKMQFKVNSSHVCDYEYDLNQLPCVNN